MPGPVSESYRGPKDTWADHIEVPIEAARAIADQHGKDQVVIVTWQRSSGRGHITTYGKSPDDKLIAARAGDIAAQTLLGFDRTECEDGTDFRLRSAAEAAHELETLTDHASRRTAALTTLGDMAQQLLDSGKEYDPAVTTLLKRAAFERVALLTHGRPATAEEHEARR